MEDQSWEVAVTSNTPLSGFRWDSDVEGVSREESVSATAHGRRVDENAAHDLSAGGVKMRFAFPARLGDIDQFQVDLVCQRGGLQRMLFALAPDEGAGHAAKFLVAGG
jgi:hypothetical protein